MKSWMREASGNSPDLLLGCGQDECMVAAFATEGPQ